MKAIDRVEKPVTFWYEDKDGNSLPFDWNKGFPDAKWHAQFSFSVLVQESICFGQQTRTKDLWLIRFIKWVLCRMPRSWKKQESSMSFNTTINCAYTVVKYLVEKRNFYFADACILYANVCERCSNILTWNAEGVDLSTEEKYLKNTNTSCKYCEVIDPDYFYRRKMLACYRTYFRNGTIEAMKTAYKEGYYSKVVLSPTKKRFFRKLLSYVKF